MTLSARNLVAIAIALLLLPVLALRAEAANGLPCDDPHIATPDEVQNGKALAGHWVCPEDAAAGVSGSAGAAKAYLKSLPKKHLSNCAPPNDANIERLNDKFATCAANFFKAYTGMYGGVVITSAFRDGAPGTAGDGSGKSANACAGGAGGSNHRFGLAIDVYPASGNFQQMWGFARANPHLGVCFPYGQSDKPHMAAAGFNTGEAATCAQQGVRSCEGGGTVDPNTIRGVGPPSADASDKFRQALGLQPQPGGQASQEMCRLPDGAQVPCSAIANRGSPPGGAGGGGAAGGAPQQALPQSSQPLQYLQPSLTNLVTPSASSASISLPYLGRLPSMTATSTKKENVSVIDSITALAYPELTTTGASSGDPFDLVVSGADAERLEQERDEPEGAALSYQGAYQPIGQQTFVSEDLGRFAVQDSFAQERSSLQSILSAMKESLLIVLEYLRPFGRPINEHE